MKITSTKTSKILIISLIALIFSNVFIFFLIVPSRGQSTDQKNILVISKGNDTFFRQSLQIDAENFNISFISATSPSISINLAGLHGREVASRDCGDTRCHRARRPDFWVIFSTPEQSMAYRNWDSSPPNRQRAYRRAANSSAAIVFGVPKQ